MLIDGSNLFFKLRELGIRQGTIEFRYDKLCDFLVRDRQVVSRVYYVGAVKVFNNDPKAMKLRKQQQRLFANLEKQNISVQRGYLMGNNGKFHEKGVDVKIATDLLIGAYENLFDVAILISSDTDLIPAIKQVKILGKAIEYIGFAQSPSFGLQKNVTLSRLLIRDEIDKFIAILNVV